jgi:hypothetical protein
MSSLYLVYGLLTGSSIFLTFRDIQTSQNFLKLYE